MDQLFEHYKKTGYLHHAHVISGVHKEVAPVLVSALERHMGVSREGNPDFVILEYQSFGIDEARELSSRQSRAGFVSSRVGGSSHKIFIISAESFTREAQNALLKTFEEPTAGTHFFIIIPRFDAVLPTLRSRVVMVDSPLLSNADETKIFAEKFLDSTLEQRFAMVKKLTVASKGLTQHDPAVAASKGLTRHDSAESKKGETVDREKIRRILDHIERILYTCTAGVPLRSSTPKWNGDIFREIFQAKTYLADRGSSPKMLLEHLAIACPYLKI